MTAELSTFNFDDCPVRVVMIGDEPWWVARDVCRVLEISDVSDAVGRLAEADRGSTPVRSGNQRRRVMIINESGLNDLILDSRKPEAKRFRRWVTSEVLPQIRRTGHYTPTTAAVAPRQTDILRAALDLIDGVAEETRANTARLDALEGKRDWFSVLAYCKYRGLRTDLTYTQILGKAAAAVGRQRGVLPSRVQDARFGLVNQWPLEILDETRERTQGMEAIS